MDLKLNQTLKLSIYSTKCKLTDVHKFIDSFIDNGLLQLMQQLKHYINTLIPHLHDATGCSTGLTTGCIVQTGV